MWALSVCWVLLGTLGAGSAELIFEKFHSITVDVCSPSEIIIPCIITNLNRLERLEYMLQWQFNGQTFFVYDGFQHSFSSNRSFSSVELLNISNLNAGVASIKISLNQVIPGNYTCVVSDIIRQGAHTIEIQYGSLFWFQPMERSLVVGAAIMTAVVFLLQLAFVAVKFKMSLLKKIICGVAVLIHMAIVVPGAVFLGKEGYTLVPQIGLGLVVLPTIILVPPLFLIFQSVFEKPPLFAIILIILKALGYLIAVAGFAASLPGCPPKQASVVIAGLGIMDLVAVTAFIYMVVIAFGFQPMERSLVVGAAIMAAALFLLQLGFVGSAVTW